MDILKHILKTSLQQTKLQYEIGDLTALGYVQTKIYNFGQVYYLINYRWYTVDRIQLAEDLKRKFL